MAKLPTPPSTLTEIAGKLKEDMALENQKLPKPTTAQTETTQLKASNTIKKKTGPDRRFTSFKTIHIRVSNENAEALERLLLERSSEEGRRMQPLEILDEILNANPKIKAIKARKDNK